MPNKNYLRGRRFEWQVKKDYESKGYHVMRTAGSHGVYDLIALQYDKKVRISFIQCKVLSKHSKSKINALLKELEKTTIIPEVYTNDVVIHVELAVKTIGDGDYTIYFIEPAES